MSVTTNEHHHGQAVDAGCRPRSRRRRSTPRPRSDDRLDRTGRRLAASASPAADCSARLRTWRRRRSPTAVPDGVLVVLGAVGRDASPRCRSTGSAVATRRAREQTASDGRCRCSAPLHGMRLPKKRIRRNDAAGMSGMIQTVLEEDRELSGRDRSALHPDRCRRASMLRRLR